LYMEEKERCSFVLSHTLYNTYKLSITTRGRKIAAGTNYGLTCFLKYGGVHKYTYIPFTL
jgi:hypothetical protein